MKDRRQLKEIAAPWSVVSATHAARIANVCSSGADWRGSAKADIFHGFYFGFPTIKTDWDRFRNLMDKAAQATASAKATLETQITEILKP